MKYINIPVIIFVALFLSFHANSDEIIKLTEDQRLAMLASNKNETILAIRRFFNSYVNKKIKNNEMSAAKDVARLALKTDVLAGNFMLMRGESNPEGGSNYLIMSMVDNDLLLNVWSVHNAHAPNGEVRQVQNVEVRKPVLDDIKHRYSLILKDKSLGF